MSVKTTNETITKAETTKIEEHLVGLEVAFEMYGTLLSNKKSFNPKVELAFVTWREIFLVPFASAVFCSSFPSLVSVALSSEAWFSEPFSSYQRTTGVTTHATTHTYVHRQAKQIKFLPQQWLVSNQALFSLSYLRVHFAPSAPNEFSYALYLVLRLHLAFRFEPLVSS